MVVITVVTAVGNSGDGGGDVGHIYAAAGEHRAVYTLSVLFFQTTIWCLDKVVLIVGLIFSRSLVQTLLLTTFFILLLIK